MSLFKLNRTAKSIAKYFSKQFTLSLYIRYVRRRIWLSCNSSRLIIHNKNVSSKRIWCSSARYTAVPAKSRRYAAWAHALFNYAHRCFNIVYWKYVDLAKTFSKTYVIVVFRNTLKLISIKIYSLYFEDNFN